MKLDEEINYLKEMLEKNNKNAYQCRTYFPLSRQYEAELYEKQAAKHQQLIDWLEELKSYRENQSVKYWVNEKEKAYNKAIDEAIEKVKEYASIWMQWNDGMTKEQIAQEALNSAKSTMIDILQQLKGGAGNEV